MQRPADNVALAAPDSIFCPLVGFDRRGGRIGQGGGHYDRYFAAHPGALRIGIGWSVQEIDATPRESTDIALDAILTEQEFILRSEEHTSELQSLMRISYAVFCLKKKKKT